METIACVRPLLYNEHKQPSCVHVDEQANTVLLAVGAKYNVFEFHRVVNEANAQRMYTEIAQQMVKTVWEDKMSCCNILHGGNQSGKSAVLFGHDAYGIFQNFLEHLLARTKGKSDKLRVNAMYLYQEEWRDLLQPGDLNKGVGISTVYHEFFGVLPQDAMSVLIQDMDDVKQFCVMLAKIWSTITAMQNIMISYSHLWLRVHIDRDDISTTADFIDLASNESKLPSVELPQAVAASKSMCWLHDYFKSRAIPNEIIPENDAALAPLIQYAFSSMAHTRVFAAISPFGHHAEQGLHTLRMAYLIRHLKLPPTTLTNSVSVIEKAFKTSITQAEELVGEAELAVDQASPSIPVPVSAPKRDELLDTVLIKLEDNLDDKQNELDQLELNLNAFIQYLKFQEHNPPLCLSQVAKNWNSCYNIFGQSVTPLHDSSTLPFPHFARLHEDGICNGKIIFDARGEELKCGYYMKSCMFNTKEEELDMVNDITLFGAGVKQSHCSFRCNLTGDKLEVVCCKDAIVYVNGTQLASLVPHVLAHNDLIILGTRNVFQVLMYEDVSRSSWQHAISDMFLKASPKINMNERARENSRRGYGSIMERIASIRTLHEKLPNAMVEEMTYDPEIDAHSTMMDQDIKNPKIRQGVRMNSASMTTRHRHSSMRRYSVAMQTEMDQFMNRLHDASVVDVLASVFEVNEICREMHIDMTFEAVPAVGHTVLVAEDDDIEQDKLRTELWIQAQRKSDLQNPFMWTIEEFKCRVSSIRSMYLVQQQSYATGKTSVESVQFNDDSHDPFYDTSKDILIGKCVVYLGGVNYLLRSEESLPIINGKGITCGELFVHLVPCIENSDGQYMPFVQEDLDKEEEQLQDFVGKQFQLNITILGARGLPENCNNNTFVRYTFYCDESPSQTPRSSVRTVHPVFSHTFHHRLAIQEDFIMYVVNEHIDIEIFGNNGRQAIHSHSKSLGAQNTDFWERLEAYNDKDTIRKLHSELAHAQHGKPRPGKVEYVLKSDCDELRLRYEALQDELTTLKSEKALKKKNSFLSRKPSFHKAKSSAIIESDSEDEIQVTPVSSKSKNCILQ